MKPYYAHGGITIYHGDCREVLKHLATGSADVTITDPPFAVRSEDWDRFESDELFCAFTAGWLGEAKRIAPLAAVFFADKYVPLLLEAAGRVAFPYRRALIWRKPPGSQYAGASLDGFWYDFEMIQVFGEPRQKATKATRFGVLDFRTVTGQKHGCEKPVRLLQTLIEAYCPPEGTVLDPFMGTGTSLAAAKTLCRCAIGIERDERYCEIAANRLAQEVLFAGV